MLLLAPKLNEKTMNGELLRHFAKLQMDEQVSLMNVILVESLVPSSGVPEL